MIIGGYVMPWRPDKFTIPREEKGSSMAVGLGVLGYMGEDAILESKEVLLEWEFMTAAQFDQLMTIYLNDEIVEWDLFGTSIPY